MTDNNLTLRLRTQNNLLELLAAGKSGKWKVGKNKENEISKVQIFNWDRTLMLEASLDISNTSRTKDNRLIVGLGADAKIIKCAPPLEWKGQNPIKYFNENSQEESEEIEEELSSKAIIVECYKKGSQLKIRVVSPGYNPDLNVRFPKDLRKEGSRYSVESLEEVQGKYYTAKGKIEKLELEEIEVSDLQELGENIPSFSEIIKDFLSEEYPDCIQDIVDKNYVYVSQQKLLNNWEAIKANGKKQEVIETAKKWAEFVINNFIAKVAYSDTKIDLFKEFNISNLVAIKLVLYGSVFVIEKTGDIIDKNNPNNLLVISTETYGIIRILMTEIIWQITRGNLSLESENDTVSIIRELIRYKDIFRFPDIEDEDDWGNLELTEETYDSYDFEIVLDYYLEHEVGVSYYKFQDSCYLEIEICSDYLEIKYGESFGFRIVRSFPMSASVVGECLYLFYLIHEESGFGWYVNVNDYPRFCGPGF